MTDIIDQAQAFDAMNLQQALQVQKAIAAQTPRAVARGYCLNPNCVTEFDDAVRLYCGPSCADQHHRIMHPGARR
ncbi:MAG TPA: hypothetical protein VJM50_23940 [Pyrinomonadaceae bacterium]|nr:hypothetical protein [Pyrinomonadaceae bacterium]